MTKVAFNRDGILNDDERLESARKCVRLLEDHLEQMRSHESSFVESVTEQIADGRCTERQLMWLRDLVGKYAQRAVTYTPAMRRQEGAC